jgi:hypothetical protein
MGTLVENERTKLLANALDRASTACVTVGVLAPVAALAYGVPAGGPQPLTLVFGAWVWLSAGIALHFVARATLGMLR